MQLKKFVFSPFQENTYVLYTAEGACCIIDPGCYGSAECQELFQFIEDIELNPKHVWLTHAHLDHIFGLDDVCTKYKISAYLNQLENPVLKAASSSAERFGIKFSVPFTEVKPLEIGEQEILPNLKVQNLHLPGHSPGSLGFYLPDFNTLIAGDVLFNESIGRTDLPGGNFETLEKSIKEVVYKLPVETIVYAGHGPHTTIGHEMQFNPYVRL